MFTHYNYTTTDIQQKNVEGKKEISSIKSRFKIVVDQINEEVTLPENSPFKDWKEARRFAGPLPFTFRYDNKKKGVLIIEGVRQNWKPQAVKVISHEISFIKELNFKNCRLANAFVISNIPYYWKKGKFEKWPHEKTL